MLRRALPNRPSRRATIVGGVAFGSGLGARALAASAEANELGLAMRDITKGVAPRSGRVTVRLPELAENGNSVSLSVSVDSPMTAADYVKTIHVLSERNPATVVARFHLSPRTGRAQVASNIRLAQTQRVVALAEMSDGSFWQGEQSVIVTLAACIDGG